MTQPAVPAKVDLVAPMSNLLALDQSSHCTGWAVFQDKQLYTFGHFTFDDEDIGLRLLKIREKVKSLIIEYKIDEVVFEDIQLQSNVLNNVKTFKILAEVFGVIYELVTELQIPNDAVLSSVWKSTLGIKGKSRPEQKRNAQQFVVSTYKVKPTQDESDAICIGTHYLTQKQEVFDWSL